MNIVMFTPVLRASAIGRMATLVVHALHAQGHNVTVVRAERESLLSEPAHDFGTVPINWIDNAALGPALARADLVVYQIGDNYDFHRGCMEWLERAPGIVCLHDYFLGHLFWAWAQQYPVRAQTALCGWYGEKIAAGYFAHPNSDAFIAATCESAPMTEWLAAMALGVISHSNWGAPRLRRACPGPVYVVPLPYNAPGALAATEKTDERNFRVLTVGHVNPNKRVASVIKAIGNSAALREHSVYRLVGHIQTDTVMSLSGLARNYQVNLVISDALDSAALVNAFEQADVITCLRWPSLEAASASAIEAMLYGKPVIVTNVHFYSEIPDDCVMKIDPDDEINSLQAALETLHNDPALRRELGARARNWAEATFRADYYAQQIVAMGARTNAIRPMMAALDWCYATLAGWGATSDMLAGPHTRDPLRLFNT